MRIRITSYWNKNFILNIFQTYGFSIHSVSVFALTLMVSCNKTATEDMEVKDKTELIKEQIELDNPTALVMGLDDPQFRAPNGGGKYTCYTAHLAVDYDCDGIAEAHWNEETTTWMCCWSKVAEMQAYLASNDWCGFYSPGTQCPTYSCGNGNDCDDGSGGDGG